MNTPFFDQSRDVFLRNLQAVTGNHRRTAASLGVRLNGRPTKYRPELAVLAFNIFIDTRVIATTGYVASMLGVSRSTLYEWMQRFPDIKAGVIMGRALQESWLATCLLHGDRNQKGILFALKNLYGWRSNTVPLQPHNIDFAQALERQERSSV